MPSDPDPTPIDRRRFFRQGLRELLKPLVRAIEPVEQTARQLGMLHEASTDPTPRRTSLHQPTDAPLWLRPPGAILEKDFLSTCSRCGVCVNVCPVQCIKLDPSGQSGSGAPYIDADTRACAVCDTLACMNQCPSGALLPVPMFDIDMGTAVWREHSCLRTTTPQDSSTDQQDCTICVDHCPLGSAAIEIQHNRVVVKPLACIGCGICQQDCPTSPKSIVVIPKSARER